ncbi:hypothetical protein BX661DRAFT_96066 [Kickxella alabastrina]|uniref:uncharacterized protein n=1 Tax=Kickxella alabastrina TaxID=61397 RepID=UPI0022210831|nr:uncharacterized protein BX661DRAFT_96066 [Kickxella alabastrina]KAI7829992.1 hypothetical protein BX661DRAFT_96066 [Kickxella alabastrina]
MPAGAFGSGGNSGRCGRWSLQHVLHGHDAAVLDVSINSDHDTVASASADGTMILWAARSGQYLRTLIPVPADGVCVDDSIPAIAGQLERYSRIERVLVSSAGLVLCYSVSGSANVRRTGTSLIRHEYQARTPTVVLVLG